MRIHGTGTWVLCDRYRGVKKSLVYSRDHTVREGLQHVKMWNSAFLHGDDLMEAMRAAMSREKPAFKKN